MLCSVFFVMFQSFKELISQRQSKNWSTKFRDENVNKTFFENNSKMKNSEVISHPPHHFIYKFPNYVAPSPSLCYSKQIKADLWIQKRENLYKFKLNLFIPASLHNWIHLICKNLVSFYKKISFFHSSKLNWVVEIFLFWKLLLCALSSTANASTLCIDEKKVKKEESKEDESVLNFLSFFALCFIFFCCFV